MRTAVSVAAVQGGEMENGCSMQAAVSIAAVLVEKSMERWSERAFRVELEADRERKTYNTATKIEG